MCNFNLKTNGPKLTVTSSFCSANSWWSTWTDHSSCSQLSISLRVPARCKGGYRSAWTLKRTCGLRAQYPRLFFICGQTRNTGEYETRELYSTLFALGGLGVSTVVSGNCWQSEVFRDDNPLDPLVFNYSWPLQLLWEALTPRSHVSICGNVIRMYTESLKMSPKSVCWLKFH